jgi:protein TonB
VVARNQGRQGEVLLALEIDPQGVLTLVRLERSSGHDLLDQAALSLVRSCGTLPPPPPGLRQIRVSVDYSLA